MPRLNNGSVNQMAIVGKKEKGDKKISEWS